MGVLGGLGYWYYQDTQERMAILNANNAKLEQATATQTAAIEKLEEDVAAAAEVQKETEEKFKVAREQVSNLQNKFNKTSALLGKRDLGTLGQARPSHGRDQGSIPCPDSGIHRVVSVLYSRLLLD